VFERATHLVESPEKLIEIFDGIEKKAGLNWKLRMAKGFIAMSPLL